MRDTYPHEMGHYLEAVNDRVVQAALHFREHISLGPADSIRPNWHYLSGLDAVAVMAAYAGGYYPEEDGHQATEITSVGMGYLTDSRILAAAWNHSGFATYKGNRKPWLDRDYVVHMICTVEGKWGYMRRQ